jgi:hypothetical protein
MKLLQTLLALTKAIGDPIEKCLKGIGELLGNAWRHMGKCPK